MTKMSPRPAFVAQARGMAPRSVAVSRVHNKFLVNHWLPWNSWQAKANLLFLPTILVLPLETLCNFPSIMRPLPPCIIAKTTASAVLMDDTISFFPRQAPHNYSTLLRMGFDSAQVTHRPLATARYPSQAVWTGNSCCIGCTMRRGRKNAQNPHFHYFIFDPSRPPFGRKYARKVGLLQLGVGAEKV